MAAPLHGLTPPLLVVNYKVYPTAIGDRAVDLTRALEEAQRHVPDATLVVAPSHPDLEAVVQSTDLPVIAQHTDGHQPGSGTGRVLVESLEDRGAAGSLVNHAERQIPRKETERSVQRLTEAGMASITCAEDVETTGALAGFEPTYVAMEPPELIGGETSVTSADPGIIEDSVDEAKRADPDARVLCGAGVKTVRDAAKAIQLGTRGVLVASGVTKADDPEQAATDLLKGVADPRSVLEE